MLDREPGPEAAWFFVMDCRLSNHFACLARAEAERFADFGLAAALGRLGRLRVWLLVSRTFDDFSVTARTKRRVMAVIARFSAGFPWS